MEIEQAIDAILSQLIQVAADGGFREGEMPPGKSEMRIEMDDLRDLRSLTGSKQVVHTGKLVKFLPLDFRRPGAIEIALQPDMKKRETAAPEIEDAETRGNEIGLGGCRGEHSVVNVPP
jgi:hypothetical protein